MRGAWLIITAVSVLSLLVLLGWAADITWLTRYGGPVPMVPTTALCVLTLVCVEVLRWLAYDGHRSHWLDAVAAGLTVTVAIGAVVSLLDGPSLNLWIWPFVKGHVPAAHMHMADSTAIALLILCVAQWVPRTGRLIAAGALWVVVGSVAVFPSSFGPAWMAWPMMIALLGLSVANRVWVPIRR